MSVLAALLLVPTPLIWLLTAVHVLVCLFLVLVVLLQRGRAGDLASAFGGGPSQANIAAMSSEDVLTRATKISAFAFMGTSLLLALLSTGGTRSVLEDEPVSEPPAAAAEEAGAVTAPAATPEPAASAGSEALQPPAAEGAEAAAPSESPAEESAAVEAGSTGD